MRASRFGSEGARLGDDAAQLGESVREERGRLGLSQSDLAFAANVSARTVYAIESGKGTVRLDVLTRVLAALGLELAAVRRDRVWRPDQPR